jgi:2-iminobutanoate/2-iminopropanoate deaminase
LFSNKNDQIKVPMKKIIATENAPKAIGPYSQAVENNGFIYTSGQIPLNPSTGEIVSTNITEQTARVLKNLEAVLKASGSSLDEVIKTTCFLKSMNDFAAMNEVYSTFFTTNFPARSTVEVARLPKDVLVEIEAIAVRK